MAETTVRRRVRHTSRTNESDRKNAAAALQRALDRRDNGGAGHGVVTAGAQSAASGVGTGRGADV
ncbi:hypothetical protein, partial [Streptomyces sp. NPDC005486]|uniref:hypothetical protein n=1 Tax=Streptomyces sp. NPDC005486 TaxID=3155345 RepID=UPI0033AFA967